MISLCFLIRCSKTIFMNRNDLKALCVLTVLIVRRMTILFQNRSIKKQRGCGVRGSRPFQFRPLCRLPTRAAVSNRRPLPRNFGKADAPVQRQSALRISAMVQLQAPTTLSGVPVDGPLAGVQQAFSKPINVRGGKLIEPVASACLATVKPCRLDAARRSRCHWRCVP
jgi:hypothetical protein